MRYISIDYGTKRVGVAISDTDGKFAFPHAVFPNNDELLPAIEKLVREKNVTAVVVGDARSLFGAENAITPEVQKFVDALGALNISVHTTREAWSSVEARRYTGEPRANDASAAAIILQRYLDTL